MSLSGVQQKVYAEFSGDFNGLTCSIYPKSANAHSNTVSFCRYAKHQQEKTAALETDDARTTTHSAK
jgi:hypothetical protein